MMTRTFASLAVLAAVAGCSAAPSSTSVVEDAPVTTTVVGADGVKVHTEDGRVFTATRTAQGWRATPVESATLDTVHMPGNGVPPPDSCSGAGTYLADDSNDRICFTTLNERFSLSQYCRKWQTVHVGTIWELECVSEWYDGKLEATRVVSGSNVLCMATPLTNRTTAVEPGTNRAIAPSETQTSIVWAARQDIYCYY